MKNTYHCEQCPKIFPNRQSRWRHKHSCHTASNSTNARVVHQFKALLTPDASTQICPPFPDIAKSVETPDPKVSAVVDTILNDGEPLTPPYIIPSPPKKKKTCDRCNKTYASSQSLWNHKQHCKP